MCRLLTDGTLPGVKVGGQWRVEEWALLGLYQQEMAATRASGAKQRIYEKAYRVHLVPRLGHIPAE